MSENYPLLSVLAQRVLSLIPSTSSVERSFKCRGHIHTKSRNRLGHVICTKLTAIRTNYNILAKEPKQSKRLFDSTTTVSDPVRPKEGRNP